MSDPLPPNAVPNPNDSLVTSPYAPPDYGQGPVPLPYMMPSTGPVKPTSVMVLGVIGIVFGAGGVLCAPVQIFGAIFARFQTPGSNPLLPQTTTAPVLAPSNFFTAWTIVTVLVNVVLAIVLLVGSIGSIQLRNWARRMILAYAVATIVFVVAALGVNFAVVLPQMARQFKAAGIGGPMVTFSGVGVVLGAIIGLIYPVFVLVFFRKPHVVDAFERGANMPYAMPPAVAYPLQPPM